MTYFAYIGIAVTVIVALALIWAVVRFIIPVLWHATGFLCAQYFGRSKIGAGYMWRLAISRGIEGGLAKISGRDYYFPVDRPWGKWHGGFSWEYDSEKTLAVMRERIRLMREEDYTVKEAIEAVPEPHKKS